MNGFHEIINHISEVLEKWISGKLLVLNLQKVNHSTEVGRMRSKIMRDNMSKIFQAIILILSELEKLTLFVFEFLLISNV